MELSQFGVWMADIYAAHGKPVPTPRIIAAAHRRIYDKPGDFLAWAKEDLCNRPELPLGNLGWMLANEFFPRWLAASGKGYREQDCCPDCDTESPGYFTAWLPADSDGYRHRFVCKCACNQRNEFKDMKRLTKSQARSRDWTVMSGGHNNPFRFECEVLYAGGPMTSADGETMLRKAASADDSVRRNHAAYLAEEELAI